MEKSEKRDVSRTDQEENLLDEETLFIVSQTFKALSDPTRIRILHLLAQKQHSVNDRRKSTLAPIYRFASITVSKNLKAR
nr:hypothetical protein [Peribacillus frigoritolerans]